jgi:hypothetical protein
VKSTDRSVDLFEVAAAAVRAGEPLTGACTEVPSYPYGCAVCEVEVDPDTGGVDVVRHTTDGMQTSGVTRIRGVTSRSGEMRGRPSARRTGSATR